MVEASDAFIIEEFRRLIARDAELTEEQKRCTNIVFSPGGYTPFEEFKALSMWETATDELHVIIHRLAEMYILCPHLRHSFLKAFADNKAKQKELCKDW